MTRRPRRVAKDLERDPMDKPSCAMCIVGAAAASLVFGGALGPKARAVEELPDLPAAASSARVPSDCARGTATVRNTAPKVVPPAGPSDAQVNASGTSAAGGGGSVPGDTR